MNKARPQSSALLNTNDSMAMHLLVETAIYDSSDYEVLSYEEVEDLKKELSFLENRIDASKRKLALESKVRDAALSLSRLYAKKGRRKSLLGGNVAATDVTKHTDEELITSNRKCEELAQELWHLNNRSVETQKRLLQHSAGILGMTHKSIASTNGGLTPSRSSASEYTFSTERAEYMSPSLDSFDDRSFYRTVDMLDSFGKMDLGSGRQGTSDSSVTEKLEGFNAQVQDLLQQSSHNQGLPPPPHLQSNGTTTTLHEQLTLLDQNIQYLQRYSPIAPQNSGLSSASERTEAILMTLWDMMLMSEDEVRHQKLEQLQNGTDQEYPESDEEDRDFVRDFSVSEFSSKVQKMFRKMSALRHERDLLWERTSQQERGVEEDMKTMQEDLRNMESQVEQLSSLLEQREVDLTAANMKIQGLMEEVKNNRLVLNDQSEELAVAVHRLDVGGSTHKQRAVDDGDVLHKHETELQVRGDLERQIEELDKKVAQKEEALVDLKILFEDLKEDKDIIKAELDAVVGDAERRLKSLEEEIANLQEGRRSAEEARDVAHEHKTELHKQLEEKEKEVRKMDQEIQELSGKVAELSTEVVMAKAELDTAYGSKSERAAATAEAKAAAAALEKASKKPQKIDPGLLTEIENLERKNQELIEEIVVLKTSRAEGANNEHLASRCKMLQKELDEMLEDFENLTKQSIEAEQERSKLESMVDQLKEKVDELKTQLAEEKISRNSPRGESTTTNVLKQEFKKMVRDMRADQARALRVCILYRIGEPYVTDSFRPNRMSGEN
jgi:DNA repair exonuclease SbcCD ATPase subunit